MELIFVRIYQATPQGLIATRPYWSLALRDPMECRAHGRQHQRTVSSHRIIHKWPGGSITCAADLLAFSVFSSVGVSDIRQRMTFGGRSFGRKKSAHSDEVSLPPLVSASTLTFWMGWQTYLVRMAWIFLSKWPSFGEAREASDRAHSLRIISAIILSIHRYRSIIVIVY